MKRALFILFLFGCMVCTHTAMAQVTVNVTIGGNDGDNDLIVYKPGRQLSIDDFEGRPDGSGMQMASTYSRISMNYNWKSSGDNATLDIVIATTFKKSESWFKKEGKTPYILNHEQRHFDITAIEACKLITAIKTHTFSIATYKGELNAIYQQYQAERREEQQKYDQETNHSIIKEQQEAWNKKIDAELKEQNCFQ